MNIVDEYRRKAVVMRVGRCCTADDLIVDLDQLVDLYGQPSSLREPRDFGSLLEAQVVVETWRIEYNTY